MQLMLPGRVAQVPALTSPNTHLLPLKPGWDFMLPFDTGTMCFPFRLQLLT